MKEEEIKRRLEYLAQRGVRWTVQRYAIMEYLYDHRIHPTAEEIYEGLRKRLPAISRATVYNTLELFKEHGLVKELLVEKERARYDYDVSPHIHLKCLRCGRIYDLFVPPPSLPPEYEGHRVEEVICYAMGVCKGCREKGDAGTS